MTLIKYKEGHEHAQKDAVTILVPGRRALGEDWVQVHVVPNAVTGGYDVKHERDDDGGIKQYERPADNKAVIIPGLSNLSTEATNFILEGALQRQEHASRHPKTRPVTDAEVEAEATRMWIDYCENKLKWLRGQTTLGPVGFNQREAPSQTHWSGVRR